MAVTIKIGGVDYSSDDPCSIADALRGVTLPPDTCIHAGA